MPKHIHIGYKNLQRLNISESTFAADIMVLTESENDIQRDS